jgi:hypothetical protein
MGRIVVRCPQRDNKVDCFFLGGGNFFLAGGNVCEGRATNGIQFLSSNENILNLEALNYFVYCKWVKVTICSSIPSTAKIILSMISLKYLSV